MRPLALRLFLPLLFLCCAASARAVPIVITGGTAHTPPGIGNFSVSLTGANFSFSAGDYDAPRQQLCGPCAPGSNLPTTIHFSVQDVPQLMYNGVSYSAGNAIITSGGFVITLPPLTVPADLSNVVAPFTFSGSVSVSPNGGSSPITFDLTGSGTATFTFAQLGGGSVLTANFNFAPAAVPEPATLLLLSTGLAALGARARRSYAARTQNDEAGEV